MDTEREHSTKSLTLNACNSLTRPDTIYRLIG